MTIDSTYLKKLPPSDLYGDEDGFDLEIDLDWKPEAVEPEEEKEIGEQFNVVEPLDPIQSDLLIQQQLERMNQIREGLNPVGACVPTQDIPHHT